MRKVRERDEGDEREMRGKRERREGDEGGRFKVLMPHRERECESGRSEGPGVECEAEWRDAEDPAVNERAGRWVASCE